MRNRWAWIVAVVGLVASGAPIGAAADVVMETVAYEGWENCIRIANDAIEIVVTTDVGPRVIRAAFIDAENVFREYPDQLGQTGGDSWRIYGGHRLWHAPEAAPRTYAPDNDPVPYAWNGQTLSLRPQAEPTTGIRKELEITLAPNANHVRILHRLTNENLWGVTLAPWALSVMTQGGRGIFPQEEYRPHPEYLLPARPLILWHYTNMADPRFTWGEKFIQLRQDPSATTKQKFGLFNKQGWMAYTLPEQVFIKLHDPKPGQEHPDYGSNVECYTDASMLELETLGPLETLEPGASVEHVEDWFLYQTSIGDTEADIENDLLPLVAQSKKLAH